MLPSGIALRMPAVAVGDKVAVAGRPGCSAVTSSPVPCVTHARPRVGATRRCVASRATKAAPPSTVVSWDDDAPPPPPNPARDARRAELQGLTLDKGLKPLCRDYDLKATGTKARVKLE
jgi:hypothetical protein